MLGIFDPSVAVLADLVRARGERRATAESCTGGLIAAACTALAGSSDWFERGVVTYSNEAKAELLGVPDATLAAHGAVSEPVVVAMAEGMLARARAHWVVAVTGIAGPGGAVPGKPVGTVWLAVARAGAPTRRWRLQLPGDRTAVRRQTVQRAFDELVAAMRETPSSVGTP